MDAILERAKGMLQAKGRKLAFLTHSVAMRGEHPHLFRGKEGTKTVRFLAVFRGGVADTDHLEMLVEIGNRLRKKITGSGSGDLQLHEAKTELHKKLYPKGKPIRRKAV